MSHASKLEDILPSDSILVPRSHNLIIKRLTCEMLKCVILELTAVTPKKIEFSELHSAVARVPAQSGGNKDASALLARFMPELVKTAHVRPLAAALPISIQPGKISIMT